jgi:hypothetical protein
LLNDIFRGKNKLYGENLVPLSYYPYKLHVNCVGIEPSLWCETLAAKFLTHAITSEFADIKYLKEHVPISAMLN